MLWIWYVIIVVNMISCYHCCAECMLSLLCCIPYITGVLNMIPCYHHCVANNTMLSSLCCEHVIIIVLYTISIYSASCSKLVREIWMELTHCGLDNMAAIFKYIFLNQNVWISLEISLKCVPKVPINNIPALGCHLFRAKPLSEPMMVSVLTHICVTQHQGVKC